MSHQLSISAAFSAFTMALFALAMSVNALHGSENIAANEESASVLGG